MTRKDKIFGSLAVSLALVIGSIALPVGAQQNNGASAPANNNAAEAQPNVTVAPANDENAEASDVPASDEVMRELLLKRKKPPVIAPTRRPDVAPPKNEIPAMPAATVNIDPTVLGVAPGDELPELLPDGQIVVNRRGRLKRTPEGFQIFVFEADDDTKPERPLIMQPCKKLESMETIVQELGDRVIFTVSGQVQLYRNNNYLLPTMVKVDYERDNLSN
ncbi:hypothetical protein JD969_18925 [Planctomycetota bacterium]|nr:hypothetical protein JD969_18925 [Planctomycetota bacterium]